MAAVPGEPITFEVPGVDTPGVAGRGGSPAAPLPGQWPHGRLKRSVRVATQRGADSTTPVEAVPGEDVVVLQIAGGPDLVLHPENARDLMMAQSSASRAGGAAAGRVTVPARLQWRGLEQGAVNRGSTRGGLGEVVLSAVHVVTDLFTGPAAQWTATEIVKRFDAQVDAGVYQLSADALPSLKASGAGPIQVPAAGGPMLVFIHGTFSDTQGTFGKLWTNHPQRVRTLFEPRNYDHRVYALDHPTLGVSPIANAVTLAAALPDNAKLHLVTHSRGGLVAEVLARVCAGGAGDLALFSEKPYEGQRAEIQQLAALVATKRISVERVVRVACPARGTLLASKRLDAYLSVFTWTLQLAGIPVVPELVAFLGAVAKHRTDPQEIPGLAAQIPDSPLVQWLHAVHERLRGQLRVIAGDIEGDSVVSWLKTLLADSFYWTDNDLVVQTRSMYGGGPRKEGASFVLDAGGKVSHFNYFTNERSAEAVVNALLQDTPPSFRPIGPLSWAGEDAGGERAAVRTGAQRQAKPALVLLPGILGSNLNAGTDRIWLGWRLINGLDRLAYPQATDIVADGPIGFVYDDLIRFLSTTHDVIPFGFDWRKPIEEAAADLAAVVQQALDLRDGKQPVRLLAHSMGGLLARAMHLAAPDVWTRMLAHEGARVLMLGTPHAGSWAPMQVLSGDDTFGNTLVAASAPFHGREARDLMARFPGFLQLQAGLAGNRGLNRRETWQRIADADLRSAKDHSWWHNLELQLKAVEWGVPTQDALDRAVALRTALDKQSLAPFLDKLFVVTGQARFTPDGFEETPDGVVYLNAPDAGDGRVTRESALLPGVRAWTVDCDHGSLPSRKEAFAGYLDLLEKGTTTLLDPLPAAAAVTRGGLAPAPRALRVRARPSRAAMSTRPAQSEQDVLSIDRRESTPDGPDAPGVALRITVHNGDLTFVRHPLMLGHYRSSRLTGTEYVMDQRIGTMDRSLTAGNYPDAPGTHEIFVNTSANRENPLLLPHPEAVIVVGLGQEGSLQSADLVKTVRHGVIAWAQRLAERSEALPPFFELAVTLIGSGGSGITAREAAQLIAQAVSDANRRLRGDPATGIDDDPAAPPDRREAQRRRREGQRWPQVGHLHIIEIYLERASEALGALQLQAAASPGLYAVTDTIVTGMAALRRPIDAGYRGADYDFVAAEMADDGHGNAEIQYTLDTTRARSEVRAQKTQRQLLLNLVTGASTALNADPLIGRTLFNLLVPIEMEPYLSGTADLQIQLDRGTAGIPWELLDTDNGDRGESRPWAIRVKLLRKLRATEFRGQVRDASADAAALVIGEPKCDPAKYPRLSGARAEARAVAACLMSAKGLGGKRVDARISEDDPTSFGPDAREVINALMAREWRIVHIAGHGDLPEMLGAKPVKDGDPPQRMGNPRGVVLSDDSYLGPREIHNMRIVPELVFVNCCHLAAFTSDALLTKDYVRFAAGVAEELIGIGVRCVIAAGWAVDDEAARLFATTFYTALLRGSRFIDAVAEAREAAWALGGNTWAAYQCYGDPDWVFLREASDPNSQPTTPPPGEEFAGVTSPTALLIALETLAVQSEYRGAPIRAQQDKIRYLADHFGQRWGAIGKVAEAFGKACGETDDAERAIDWYHRAVEAADGTASMKAAEQIYNWRVRRAWRAIDTAAGAAAASPGTDAGRALADVIARERPRMAKAIEALEHLAEAHPSMERESLCGSAYKRLAMLEAEAGRRRREAAALAQMQLHYARAEERGRARGLDVCYPAMNQLAAELALHAGARGWRGVARARLTALRKMLETKAGDEPEFRTVAGVTEWRVYDALQKRVLAARLTSISEEFAQLYERVNAVSKWRSTYDTARLVLSKYAQRAAPNERQAANALLGQLAGWAGVPSPSASSASSASVPPSASSPR